MRSWPLQRTLEQKNALPRVEGRDQKQGSRVWRGEWTRDEGKQQIKFCGRGMRQLEQGGPNLQKCKAKKIGAHKARSRRVYKIKIRCLRFLQGTWCCWCFSLSTHNSATSDGSAVPTISEGLSTHETENSRTINTLPLLEYGLSCPLRSLGATGHRLGRRCPAGTIPFPSLVETGSPLHSHD